ncbi:MAG: thiamine phosphate synthase [Myxococcota bacterium]
MIYDYHLSVSHLDNRIVFYSSVRLASYHGYPPVHSWLQRKSLYLITQSPFKRAHWPILEKAIQGGVAVVQLRDKTATQSDLKDMALFLKPRLAAYGVPLIINDHLEVAKALQLGLHLGLEDGCPREARSILGPERCIGLTVHRWLAESDAVADVIDYVGCGPVFNTITKPDAKPSFGVDVLSRLCQDSTLPVVAIGGIGVDNIESVWRAEPNAVAVSSAIWMNPNPMLTAQKLSAAP